MGKIQNLAIQTLGVGAAAAAAADKEMQGAKLDEEQGLLAQQQYHEASADITSLEGESATAGKNLETVSKKVEASEGWNMSGKNAKMLAGKKNKLLTEQEAAKRAFDELQDRIEAKKAMMSRAEKIMKRTGTWGGMK